MSEPKFKVGDVVEYESLKEGSCGVANDRDYLVIRTPGELYFREYHYGVYHPENTANLYRECTLTKVDISWKDLPVIERDVDTSHNFQRFLRDYQRKDLEQFFWKIFKEKHPEVYVLIREHRVYCKDIITYYVTLEEAEEAKKEMDAKDQKELEGIQAHHKKNNHIEYEKYIKYSKSLWINHPIEERLTKNISPSDLVHLY